MAISGNQFGLLGFQYKISDRVEEHWETAQQDDTVPHSETEIELVVHNLFQVHTSVKNR